MTRKDYIKIAKVLRDIDMPIENKKVYVYKLTDMLAQDNDRFDRDRFITASLGE